MGIGWSFEKFVKPTSSNWGRHGRLTEPLAKEAASSYEIFLEGFAKIVIQLQLLMDHEAEQGEN